MKKLERAANLDKPMHTLRNDVCAFLNWKATHARRASVNYRIWLERFIELADATTLEEISIGDVVTFQHYLEAHYAPYTVQFAMIAVRGFFKFHRMNGRICVCPELVRTPRTLAKSHRAISENEYSTLLSVVPQTFLGVRDSLMFRILHDTGIRLSELCDLNTTEIEPEKNYTAVITRKNNQRRMIVWSEETHRLLLRYMEVRVRLGGDSALFISLYGDRLTHRSVQVNLNRYLSLAGIRTRLTPHSFRHGWAHRRRDQNAPLAFIQKGLGHVSPTSTFVYQQYYDEDFLQTASKYLK